MSLLMKFRCIQLLRGAGCKIKALRAKTNTYIKTPVRGEEPVFVVTGRKEDVTKAKREILSAAEHFSLIRATRKPSAGNSLSVVPSNENNVNSFVANAFVKIPSKPSMPGQVTIQVRVPYRVVGLVVGPKGTTIKHIQHQTQTYIVTPSREKEPIFEVTGLPNNVQSARQQIEAHIALRTGSLDPIGINSSNSAVVHSGPLNDVSSDHSLSALSKILSDPTIDADILLSLCKDNSMSSSPGYEVEACEERTKKTSGEGLEAQGRDRKNGFDIISLENDFFEKQTNFLHPDTIQFQYFNTSNHALDYTNDLEGKINIKTSSGQRSYFLADLDSALNVQKQKEQLYPSFQPTFTLNHKLQNSSVPSMKRNKFFRSDSTASSYMQLNFATNTTSEGSPGIQNASIDTQNSNSNRITRSCSSASSTASSRSANNSGSCSSSRPELINIWKHFGESLDLDEGFGDLPNIWTLPTSLSTLKSSNSSPSTSISPTDSYSCEIPTHTHSYKVALNRLINESHHECKINKSLLEKKHIKKDDVMRTILYDSATPRLECLVCNKNKVNAVLVPCGHNMLCMECANHICELDNGICPICSLNVYHATRVTI